MLLFQLCCFVAFLCVFVVFLSPHDLLCSSCFHSNCFLCLVVLTSIFIFWDSPPPPPFSLPSDSRGSEERHHGAPADSSHPGLPVGTESGGKINTEQHEEQKQRRNSLGASSAPLLLEQKGGMNSERLTVLQDRSMCACSNVSK